MDLTYGPLGDAMNPHFFKVDVKSLTLKNARALASLLDDIVQRLQDIMQALLSSCEVKRSLDVSQVNHLRELARRCHREERSDLASAIELYVREAYTSRIEMLSNLRTLLLAYVNLFDLVTKHIQANE